MTARPFRRISTVVWLGYCAGLVITPLLLFGYARAITAFYSDELSTSAEYGVALAVTRDIAVALDRYRTQHHRVPDAEEGLATLAPDYLKGLSVDPWGNPFIYEPHSDRWADVLSYGSDGRPGGSGNASDISARYGRLGRRPPSTLDTLASIALVGVPLAALTVARRWPWGAGVLGGTATLWAVLLLATLSSAVHFSVGRVFVVGVALACMTGGIATLRATRGARVLTVASIFVAQLTLAHFIGG